MYTALFDLVNELQTKVMVMFFLVMLTTYFTGDRR
jgi:hypothetical protein